MKIWTSVKFQRTFSRKNIPFDNLNICVSINFVSNIRFLFITGYYWTSIGLCRISEDSDYLYKTSIDFQKNFFSKKKKKIPFEPNIPIFQILLTSFKHSFPVVRI